MLPIAILAGGYATRLGSLTQDLPKCLINVNGRPFIDWQLDLLIKQGYSEFVFCLSHMANAIQDHLGDGRNLGVKINYSLDGKTQLGTGGAIYNALPFLGESFAVIYGDSFLPINYEAIESEFQASNCQALMTVFKNRNEFDLSNVEFRNKKLIRYQKGSKSKKMTHIDYGLTYFHRKAFSPFGDTLVFDLGELCYGLSTNGELCGVEVFNRFYEIGSHQGIKDFSDYLRRVEYEL